jgi:hypothetical protein
MGEIKEYGTSRRKLLRAADTVGVSGALLGAHMGGARGQEEREGEASSAGIEYGSHGGTRRREVQTLRSSLKAI